MSSSISHFVDTLPSIRYPQISLPHILIMNGTRGFGEGPIDVNVFNNTRVPKGDHHERPHRGFFRQQHFNPQEVLRCLNYSRIQEASHYWASHVNARRISVKAMHFENLSVFDLNEQLSPSWRFSTHEVASSSTLPRYQALILVSTAVILLLPHQSSRSPNILAQVLMTYFRTVTLEQ